MTTLTVRTERQSQLVDITRLVRDAVAGKHGSAVLVYVPHTTAGVTINEHADPMVARDFEMALERLGCAAAEAVMVGDGLTTDIAGGRAAGMATVWLDPGGANGGEGQADLVVPDLARLLEAWQAARA